MEDAVRLALEGIKRVTAYLEAASTSMQHILLLKRTWSSLSASPIAHHDDRLALLVLASLDGFDPKPFVKNGIPADEEIHCLGKCTRKQFAGV